MHIEQLSILDFNEFTKEKHELESYYEVCYITKGRKIKRHKEFTSLEQVGDWCKRNKGKVTIWGASWQVFEIMKSI